MLIEQGRLGALSLQDLGRLNERLRAHNLLQDKGAVDADCVVLRGAQNVQCMMFLFIVHCSDCYVAMQALINM